MMHALVFLVGVVIGYFASAIIRGHRCGILHVRSDCDGTYLTLQIRRLSDVLGHKEVTFVVKNESSRE